MAKQALLAKEFIVDLPLGNINEGCECSLLEVRRRKLEGLEDQEVALVIFD